MRGRKKGKGELIFRRLSFCQRYPRSLVIPCSVFLSLSLVSKLIADVVNIKSTKMGVNYGLNKVRFPSPVLVDSRLRVSGSISDMEVYGELEEPCIHE